MRAFALYLALITGACAHSSTPPATEAAEGKRPCCDSDSCPMTQDGVQVVYEDTADGAAMVFTASDVVALQTRVGKMAEKHGAKGEASEHQGEHHGDHHAEHHGDHHEQEVLHSARADNTAQGARLVMTPTDPAQLDALRAHVKGHVEKMQRGECPMKSCH